MSIVKTAEPVLFVLAVGNAKTFEAVLKDKKLCQLALKALVEIVHNIPLHKALTKNLSVTGKAATEKKRVILRNRGKIQKTLEKVLEMLHNDEI